MSTGTMLRSATPPTIPHMIATLLSWPARALGRPLPILNGDLARACKGQLPRRRLAGHGSAGADGGTLPDSDRRHQHAARADEGAAANLGAPLIGAIVVAGDRARTDIDVVTDV